MLKVYRKDNRLASPKVDSLLRNNTVELLEIVLTRSPLRMVHVPQLREEIRIENERVVVVVVGCLVAAVVEVENLLLLIEVLDLLIVQKNDICINDFIIEPSTLSQPQKTLLLYQVVLLLDERCRTAYCLAVTIADDVHCFLKVRLEN